MQKIQIININNYLGTPEIVDVQDESHPMIPCWAPPPMIPSWAPLPMIPCWAPSSIIRQNDECETEITTEEAARRLDNLLLQGPIEIDTISADKGKRGKELERMIGLKNTNSLTDFKDGELKTFNATNTNINITQLGHCLSEIEANIPYERTKFAEKMEQVIYVPFKNNKCTNYTLSNKEKHPEHYSKIQEDYEYLSKQVRDYIETKTELPPLGTIKSPHNVLCLSGHGSKAYKNPEIYKGNTLFKYYVGFYIRTQEVMTLK